MAKPGNRSAGASGKKKPRHTAAQKKAARLAREKQARAQLKGKRQRPSGDRYGDERPRGRDSDRGGHRGQGDRGGYDRRDDRGGYQRREDRGGYQRRDERGGYDRRDERGGYQRREDRGGYQRRDERGGYDRRDERGGYQRREDRGGYDRRDERGGYQRRDERGGYQRRDDRGGYQRRDERGGYQRREDRGGYQRRDDRGGYDRGQGRRRWADEDRSDWRQERREREAREERGGRTEHVWRARRDEREGRQDRRGHHEGRGWEERRHRDDDRFGEPERRGPRRDRYDDRRGDRRYDDRRDDRFDGPSPDEEREAAEAAYQEHLASGAREDATATVTEDNGFARLGLHEDLVAALARTGITQPFPIQAATIPDALAGKDLLGRGQTGSGKTMAFGLPMLHRLAGRPRAVPHRPRALVLTPTRELAMQIVDALAPLMRAVDKRFLLVAGGMSYTPQLAGLERGVDVLVATPGRLIDLVERSAADLSEVEVAVLDEADHMAEMGFVEAIREILDLTPADGQRLLFSATLDHGVDQVAATYLTDPVTHSTDDVAASVDTMDHHVFLVHPHHKRPITAAIANRAGRTLVFCRTKLGADRVAMQLRESGIFAAALHGGLNQAQRTRVLDAFKKGTLPVLVATDVAARGIHVDDVSLVLQVDPPADHKDYLHRAGRTARAGDEGVVVTLALPHQKKQVARLLDAAGVETGPQQVAPEDVAVIETAGGSVPDAEPVPQSRLDEVLRPRRPQRQGGRGRYGDRGGRGGRGSYGGGRGGYRGGRGSYGGGRDSRPDRRPRD